MTFVVRLLAAILLAAIALPADAAWKRLRRDNLVMLSVDSASIKREGNVASFRYLVDFRVLQGEGHTQYRSAISYAKADCKARTLSLTHTDAYLRYGGEGVIVAKSRLTPAESAFQPLEKGSSDEDLWAFVCEGKVPPASSAMPPPPPPIPQKPKK
jgi:hypothetical protein